MNIFPEATTVSRQDREAVNGHKGGVMWFTGLSGSGKSTLAKALQKQLFCKGYQIYVLDGDNIRAGLNSDLGFSPDDRTENIRRIGEVASLFAQAGLIVIVAFISPYKADRQRARNAAGDAIFSEIHIKASVEACEARDVKGLYKKAREGAVSDFTGVSAPYEIPDAADLVVDTENMTIEQALEALEKHISSHFAI